MKKIIFQFLLVLASSVSFLYFLIHLSARPASPQTQAITITPDIANKMAIFDFSNSKTALYENDELKKKFPIEKPSSIEHLASGLYAASQFKQNDFGKQAAEFISSSTKIFILNKNKTNGHILDAEGFYFQKEPPSISTVRKDPKVSAEAFLIADMDSGSAIFQKNSDKQFPIASISKLTTALVALEKMDPDKYITITKKMLADGYGDYGNLRIKEQLTVNELIYPLLLSSSNDAAYALATDYGQSDFVSAMNEKAATIGLPQTRYEEPSGISPKNVSTTQDLFHLVQYIYNNKKWIFDITRLKKINDWRNGNFFSGNKNYLGGKNGYIDESKETSIALFSLPLSPSENRKIAIILLRSKDREADALSALKWLDDNVEYRPKINPIKEFSSADVDRFSQNLKRASLTFVGNIMLDRGVKEEIFNKQKGDFSFLFEKADIKKADIAAGNLQGPMSDIGQNSGKQDAIRNHPLSAIALQRAGFNALLIANDHIDDWGKDAFEDTIFRLNNEQITPIGNAADATDEASPQIIEKNGIKFGLIGFSDSSPMWLKIKTNSANIMSTNDNFAQIIKKSSNQADVLAVLLYTNKNKIVGADQTANTESLKGIAETAIDNGAKITVLYGVANSPKIENYKDGLIISGLGNFVTDQRQDETTDGSIAEITITGTGNIKHANLRDIKINQLYQPEVAKN